MRGLTQARQSWHELQSIKDTGGYRSRLSQAQGVNGLESRSLYWKLFLLFEEVDHASWLRKLEDTRSAYVSLRTHLLRAISYPDEVDAGEDPLSETGTPRWDGLRRDEALRVEIMQDVDRCMPDNTFFREQQTHSMMLDILFIFCKLNPDVSYRQGMHELLAPVLWVVQTDAVQDPSHSADDFMVSSIFDSRFIEHDAFTLFSVLMQDAKIFYEQKAHQRRSDIGTLPTSGSLENPITTIINRMFTDYLPRLDPELAIHLRDLDLVPQVFLVRWIRLLFGREFPFDDVLPMWDLIFSEDPQLDSVEMICLVMILRLRWDLIEADHNDALSMLLRYPALESFQPQDLVRDALRLKSAFNAATAREIIEKYTDRPVTATELPDPDDFALPELPTPTPRPRNIEQILSATARNVYVRSEKWGINKALRDAVDEVKRNVRDIQAMPTPTISSPRRHSRLSRSSVPRVDNMSELKLVSLTQRTTKLAAQLKTATDSLWEIQRVLGEERGPDDGVVKDLGMAIARVGFVQVYLEDGSIPLATADEGDEKAAVDEKEDFRPRVPAKEKPADSKVAEAPAKADTAAPDAGQAATPQASRPPLSQSPFSWMLGQSPTSSAPERVRASATLFGDADDEPGGGGGSSASSSTRKKRERKIVRLGAGTG